MLRAHGVEVIGVETASREELNQWEVNEGVQRYRRVQVFPDATFEHVPPKEMERGMWDALDELQPDAVGIMSYGFPDARAALGWCRARRKTAIIMTDTKEDDAPRVAWRETIKRAIVGEFDAALAAGKPQAAYLKKLGFPSSHIFTGYDVVDNEYYRTGAAEARANREAVSHLPGLSDSRPFFLSINRLLPYKNIDSLIQAYAAYRARAAEPWRLLLVGDGPDRDRLAAYARELSVEDVVFCGYQQAATITAYYGLASAFVHPSKKDTWGLVVNEAMAA
ncbi:MAG: glycosyltransferase, partial [Bacteroidota bacterium]